MEVITDAPVIKSAVIGLLIAMFPSCLHPSCSSQLKERKQLQHFHINLRGFTCKETVD